MVIFTFFAHDSNIDLVKSMHYDLVFEKRTDIKINSILCIPIKNADQEVIGMVQLANKIDNNGRFCSSDLQILKHYIEYCGTILVKSQMYYLCAYEYERCQCLLEVLHGLFKEQTDLEKIFYTIIEKAQILLKCENCLILIQTDLGESEEKKSFDVYQIDVKPKHSVLDNQVVISHDLVNYVLTTGESVNLKSPYSDPRFDPNVDLGFDFLTNTKLLMPIKNLNGEPIGCIRVLNRIDNQPFDENDEQLLEAFCIFCGLGITNTLMFRKLEKSVAEKSVAFDVLSYHANYPKIEMEAFVEKLPPNERFFTINPMIHVDYLCSYRFDDFSLNQDEMVVASYEMFKRLGLIKSFKIDKKTLFQFLLTVRKNYRDVEFHNWSHAFNVCQNMFAIFMVRKIRNQNSKISKYLQDTEKMALMVGCLCHDLDHRGTNNLFQIE
ncbi:Dual 3 -5 -cyclic-AMP and -GMP phosphodiesterase [Brachionus plicatilis]|uniref:Phosphodiesterase n=1 Tax=Brachionus plicatilis TaxID=10195 RepID=A0A3M7SWH0_BRAPC|nr:Dual 3 -5 -cyclic-AMP and -GMP phosphodiesterase [Brachionus plicatilis]